MTWQRTEYRDVSTAVKYAITTAPLDAAIEKIRIDLAVHEWKKLAESRLFLKSLENITWLSSSASKYNIEI